MSERVDPKYLGDIVAGWIGYPDTTSRLGLSSASIVALLRVDSSAYGDAGESTEVWQDPRSLQTAVEELRAALRRIPRGRLGRLAWKDASIRIDSLDLYDTALEDVGQICQSAASLGKRVALVAW